MKIRFLIIILFMFFCRNSFSGESSDRSNKPELRCLGISALYSHGKSMEMSNSSSNWSKKINPAGDAVVAQITHGWRFTYLYFDALSFFGVGILGEYEYLNHEYGDIQSVNIGCDFRFLWILKVQAGMGKSFAKREYTVTHGYRWNDETREDSEKFNNLSWTFAYGVEIPIAYNISLSIVHKYDLYSGPFLACGSSDLSRDSLCFGLKAVLFSY